jgi:hypothetical protein
MVIFYITINSIKIYIELVSSVQAEKDDDKNNIFNEEEGTCFNITICFKKEIIK